MRVVVVLRVWGNGSGFSLFFRGMNGCCCLPGVWVCWISQLQLHSTYCIYPELHSVHFWAVIRLVLRAREPVGSCGGRWE